MYIFRHFVRFFSAFIGIMLVDIVVPGFSSSGMKNTALVSLLIAGVGWVAELLLGSDISPFARGIIGMITAATVLSFVSFLIPAFQARLLGSVLASLLIGIIDIFVPIGARFTGE